MKKIVLMLFFLMGLTMNAQTFDLSCETCPEGKLFLPENSIFITVNSQRATVTALHVTGTSDNYRNGDIIPNGTYSVNILYMSPTITGVEVGTDPIQINDICGGFDTTSWGSVLFDCGAHNKLSFPSRLAIDFPGHLADGLPVTGVIFGSNIYRDGDVVPASVAGLTFSWLYENSQEKEFALGLGTSVTFDDLLCGEYRMITEELPRVRCSQRLNIGFLAIDYTPIPLAHNQPIVGIQSGGVNYYDGDTLPTTLSEPVYFIYSLRDNPDANTILGRPITNIRTDVGCEPYQLTQELLYAKNQ